jgi:hypothetical protein
LTFIHTIGEGSDCTMLVKFRDCWECFHLLSRILALSHTVWFVFVGLSNTWLFLYFHMLHNMTLKTSCWTVSSRCIIENKLSVTVLLISTPSTTVNDKPVCCQHCTFLWQIKNTYMHDVLVPFVTDCTIYWTLYTSINKLNMRWQNIMTNMPQKIFHFRWNFCVPYQVPAACNAVPFPNTCIINAQFICTAECFL